MTSITCGNCKGTHASVAAVKSCYAVEVEDTTCMHGVPYGTVCEDCGDALLPCEVKAIAKGAAVAAPPATDKQVDFILKLQMERNCLQDRKEVEVLTKENARALITALLAMPKPKAAQVEVPALDDGMYRVDTTFIKVYHTVHGANAQVAKVLVVEATANADGTTTFTGEWDYRGKAGLKGLTAANKLTEDEAKTFGQVYGFCCRCAKTLTQEESLYVGYGPTCAGHEGWWYPTAKELKALTKEVVS